MLRKALLATSALVIAGSMALANVHPTHRTPGILEQLHRKAMIAKGMIVNEKGVALGVRYKPTAGASPPGKPARTIPPGTGYSNFGKSKNALFISWFGWLAGTAHAHSGPYSGSFCYSSRLLSSCAYRYRYRYSITETIQQSAAEPFHGKGTVSSISIGAEQYSGSGGAAVGLYSNTTVCASSLTPSCPGNALGSGSFSKAPAFTGLCCSGLETISISPAALDRKKQYWVVVGSNGASGRVAWNGQAGNWTRRPFGEQFRYTLTEVIQSTYSTTKYGYHNSYHSTFHGGSSGWVHTNAFTFGEQPGAFSVN